MRLDPDNADEIDWSAFDVLRRKFERTLDELPRFPEEEKVELSTANFLRHRDEYRQLACDENALALVRGRLRHKGDRTYFVTLKCGSHELGLRLALAIDDPLRFELPPVPDGAPIIGFVPDESNPRERGFETITSWGGLLAVCRTCKQKQTVSPERLLALSLRAIANDKSTREVQVRSNPRR